MDASSIPERWVTGSPRPAKHIDGPDEALWHAHAEAGKPHDFKAFRMGYEAGVNDARKAAAVPADLLAELQKAHRIIYLQRMQMSTPAKTLYARNAHAAGLIDDDETRDSERSAVLARAGVSL